MADTVTVPTVPPLATIANVELLQTGTWATFRTPDGSPTLTFTTDDVTNAVAAMDCPAVRRPILKLGHVDPRFNNPDMTPNLDGEPCVGWIANLAAADDGRTLVGDYVGMPGWLGEVLASAYPDRSVEAEWDYVCQLGHTHPFVLHAVALLGVARPGVGTLTSLQDIAELYGVAARSTPSATGTPVTFTVNAAARAREDAMPNPNPRQVAAGVTTEDVRRAYYAGPGDSWDQWIESMQLDPVELIVVDDAKGKRFRVPVSIGAGDGEDAVSFGDAVEVVIRYEDAKAAATAGQPAQRITWASRTESRPDARQDPPAQPPAQQDPTAPAGGNTATASSTAAATNQEGPAAVDFTDQELADLRARLGLAEDAELTAAQVLAALSSTPSSTHTDQGTGQQPAAATAGAPGTIVVDADAWNEQQKRIRRLEDQENKRRREEGDSLIGAAIQAGKFAPARREHWRRLWEADPEGTRQALAGLTPNVVPVNEVGIGDDSDADFDAEFAHLYPPQVETSRS